ncbi:MAG: LPS export ABC transporter permease LptG [Gammaproteobacteria bacterium]|nr:LPS export ABC transporter permease LptG [Gammaproteobacteria bacterium]
MKRVRLFSTLDQYIGQAVMLGTVFVITLLFLLFSFIGFVDGLKFVGKANFGLWELVQFVLLSQPKSLYLLMPAAALVGSTVGLSYLAANSELIAMRAAGVSIWRVGGAVLKTGMIFVIGGMLIGEYLVPVTEEMAQQGRAESLEVGFSKKKYTGLWLRQDHEFINVREVLPDKSLLRINIFRFDKDMQLQAHTEAERAYFDNGNWVLNKVLHSDIDKDRVRAHKYDDRTWQTGLTPDVLTVFTVKPESLSLLQLRRYITHLKQNFQQTNEYELAFWRKLFSPLAMAVMLLLAIPFVFSPLRAANMGSRIFVGILIALAFYMVNLSFGSFALIRDWPPLMGAAAPPLVFLLLAAILFRRAA